MPPLSYSPWSWRCGCCGRSRGAGSGGIAMRAFWRSWRGSLGAQLVGFWCIPSSFAKAAAFQKQRPRITIRTAETSVSHVASGTSGEDESVDEAPVSWLEKRCALKVAFMWECHFYHFCGLNVSINCSKWVTLRFSASSLAALALDSSTSSGRGESRALEAVVTPPAHQWGWVSPWWFEGHLSIFGSSLSSSWSCVEARNLERTFWRAFHFEHACINLFPGLESTTHRKGPCAT